MVIVNGKGIEQIYKKTIFSNGESSTDFIDKMYFNGKEVHNKYTQEWRKIYSSDTPIVNDTGGTAVVNIADLINNAVDGRITFAGGYFNPDGSADAATSTYEEDMIIPLREEWQTLFYIGGGVKIRAYLNTVQLLIPYRENEGKNLGIVIYSLEEYS